MTNPLIGYVNAGRFCLKVVRDIGADEYFNLFEVGCHSDFGFVHHYIWLDVPCKGED